MLLAPLARSCVSSRGALSRGAMRGLTLIELLVTMALIALVTTSVLMGSGAAVNARMRSSASMIAGRFASRLRVRAQRRGPIDWCSISTKER